LKGRQRTGAHLPIRWGKVCALTVQGADMGKNYKWIAIKLLIGVVLVAGAWWLVKCQCVNLKSLTPAALRDFIQSFGKLAVLAYIIAYVLNTVSIMPPIAALSLTAGLVFGAVWGAIRFLLCRLSPRSL